LIYAFIGTLPRELDEAAIIDGCSPFRLFFSVIYPLLTPVLVTAGVLNLLGIWNEFLLPLYYLNSSGYWPMTLAVYNFFGQFQADWSLVSADIVLTILPVIVIYLFAQRFHPLWHDGGVGEGIGVSTMNATLSGKPMGRIPNRANITWIGGIAKGWSSACGSTWQRGPAARRCTPRRRRPATGRNIGSTRNGAPTIFITNSHSSFKADILPVASTHLGPGSLAAILGAELEGREDTIWIHPRADGNTAIVLDEANRWYRLHLDLVRACKAAQQGRYFVGCPDLIEGLDTLAGLHGTQAVLLDTVDRPDELEAELQAVNDIWFTVFDRIYDVINEDGEMAFCYFSIWGPGRVAKLQSDISIMMSPQQLPPVRAALHPPAMPVARLLALSPGRRRRDPPPRRAAWRSTNSTPSSGRRASASRRAATRAGTTCTSASWPAASRSCRRGSRSTNSSRCSMRSGRRASTS
jgi:hypothetical protein